MLRVEAVAECMGNHLVVHYPTMPGVGKTPQAVVATRCLEDSLHRSMMTTGLSVCKMEVAGETQGPSTSVGMTELRRLMSPTQAKVMLECPTRHFLGCPRRSP